MDAGFTYRDRSCKSPEFFVSHLFQSWLHSKPAYLENFQQKQSNFKHVFAMMGNGFTVAENHEDTGKALSLHSLIRTLIKIKHTVILSVALMFNNSFIL